ncbi:MAG: 50S ribosomal protein L35 [Helicobacteraceae bacterium]
MPKMKTKRSAAKRFAVKKDHIKRGSAFRSHILTKMSKKRKRNLRSPQKVHRTNEKNIRLMLAQG